MSFSSIYLLALSCFRSSARPHPRPAPTSRLSNLWHSPLRLSDFSTGIAFLTGLSCLSPVAVFHLQYLVQRQQHFHLCFLNFTLPRKIVSCKNTGTGVCVSFTLSWYSRDQVQCLMQSRTTMNIPLSELMNPICCTQLLAKMTQCLLHACQTMKSHKIKIQVK